MVKSKAATVRDEKFLVNFSIGAGVVAVLVAIYLLYSVAGLLMSM